ncbi:DUF4431 domain-containing protein [Xenorhabdus griffiniae]|uniref:DUF4431 domain-containing protein n=1 Tax=Xenorhabdus griffiniae TaxID=351672 RepID=UPI0030CACACA
MLKKIAVTLFLVSATANAASFDCSKATSKAEKLICSTPALSQADDALYVDYLQAKVVTGNSNDFKALVKQNWKLREKNCDTEECLLGWYKRSTALYRQIAGNSRADNSPAINLQYSKLVTVSGLLTIVDGDDEGLPYSLKDMPAIKLDSPVNVIAPPDEEEGSEKITEMGVDIMQLAMNNNGMIEKFRQMKGQKARVMCSLYHSHTAHHVTPVVCDVDRITSTKNQPKQTNDPVTQSVSSKKSLDDFFRDNPSLSGFYVKRAIKNQAAGVSIMDAMTSTDSSKSKLKITSDQLNTNGYEYAKLAVRQLQELCSMGMATMHSLKNADCAAIISYVEK